MKKRVILLFLSFLATTFLIQSSAMAQCSLCTKTAMQLGEGPAKGLNAGILYLAFTPIIGASILIYRWWKKEKPINDEDNALIS